MKKIVLLLLTVLSNTYSGMMSFDYIVFFYTNQNYDFKGNLFLRTTYGECQLVKVNYFQLPLIHLPNNLYGKVKKNQELSK